MPQRAFVSLLVLFSLLASAARLAAWDADPPLAPDAGPKFIRVERDDEDEPLALQTAMVDYVSTDPAQAELTVDLIGAVHVGDKAYYDALNQLFEKYDAVLYELVAPAGTKIPKGAKPGGHPVAMLQNGLKEMLNLEHQLECIDYTKANMVHADMSPDEFAKSISERKESFFSLFFRLMGQAMARQSQQKSKSKSGDVDLLSAFLNKDRSGAIKRVMAEQFEDLESMMDALSGPEGSTIITERNKVVLKKLSEQTAAGNKKIAIFFGAGHMGHIAKQLESEFHLRRASEARLTAWKLEPAEETEPAAKEPTTRSSP